MKRFIVICSWVFVISVCATLHAQEDTGSSVNLNEFDDAAAETPIKEHLLESILNKKEEEFAKEFIAKAITSRYKFLDVSYVSPDDDSQKDGWNLKYDWHYRSGSEGGFSVDSGVAKLDQIALEADISGSYSYGSADNVEDYSTAKLAFSYLYGDFGKLRVIDKDKSNAFQECLQKALSLPTDTEMLAAEDQCWLEHKIAVNDPSQSYVLSVSATGGLEGEQDYGNKQYTYGIRGIFSRDRFPSVRLDFERIDASDDAVRTALTDDNKYDRISGELGYRYPIFNQEDYNTWFYISYRYFKEISAPESIRNSDLDAFDFVSASIRFPAKLLSFIKTDDFNFYIRYTDGQLPFDRQSDKSVQLGLSSNISILGKLFAE